MTMSPRVARPVPIGPRIRLRDAWIIVEGSVLLVTSAWLGVAAIAIVATTAAPATCVRFFICYRPLSLGKALTLEGCARSKACQDCRIAGSGIAAGFGPRSGLSACLTGSR